MDGCAVLGGERGATTEARAVHDMCGLTPTAQFRAEASGAEMLHRADRGQVVGEVPRAASTGLIGSALTISRIS
jgi:hypothetical protein